MVISNRVIFNTILHKKYGTGIPIDQTVNPGFLHPAYGSTTESQNNVAAEPRLPVTVTQAKTKIPALLHQAIKQCRPDVEIIAAHTGTQIGKVMAALRGGGWNLLPGNRKSLRTATDGKPHRIRHHPARRFHIERQINGLEKTAIIGQNSAIADGFMPDVQRHHAHADSRRERPAQQGIASLL